MAAMRGTRPSTLRELRLARCITQEALASEVRISRQAYAAIESGSSRPSVDGALRIARALATTVERLFGADSAPGSMAVPFVGTMPSSGGFPVRLAEVRGRLLAFPTRRSVTTPADGIAEPGTDGNVQVRPFLARPPVVGLVVAGCDPAFALVADALRRRGVEVMWVQAGSRAALEMLANGQVHVGGVHLMDPSTGTYNRPWVERWVPDPCALVRFANWEECLVLASGNPLGVDGIHDIARPGLRFVNREEGSGSRAVLDRALDDLGMNPGDVAGYHSVRASGHLDVAAAVAMGAADAGVGIRGAAAVYGLHTIALGEEPYDLVIPEALIDLPSVRALTDLLASQGLREQVGALGGYDTARMGTGS